MPAKERRPERESRKGDEEAFFHALLEGHDRALPKLIKRNRRLLDILSVREMMTSAHDSKSTKLLPRERKSSSHDHIPESSPLVFALRFGHTSVVRVLLAAGADPNTVDAMHDTPLLAACRLAMDEACDSEPVRLLLEHRANPDLAPAGVQAPLLLSCAKGVAQVVGWLISAGADLDLRDDNGCTALHLSCLRGDAQVAAACTRQLLAAGAEPDAVTESGMVRPSPRLTPGPAAPPLASARPRRRGGR
jgi:ankyrin repeat protein